MLTSFRLGNFKAFGETQTIPLRPLTLIFGPNSSGKSSIIHGLLFVHEANRTGNPDVRRTYLGGESVDLGGYFQFIHGAMGAELESNVQCAVEFDLMQPGGRPAERLAPTRKLGICWTIDHAGLSSCVVDADGRGMLRVSQPESSDYEVARALGPSDPPKLRIAHIDQRYPALQDAIEVMAQVAWPSKIGPIGKAANIDHIANATLRNLVVADRFLPNGVFNVRETMAMTDESDSSAHRYQRDSRRVTVASRILTQAVDNLLRNLSEVVTDQLERLSYLGPIRTYPPRNFVFEEDQDPDWLAGGGQAYEIVRRDKGVRDAINKWLGNADKLSTPYEILAEHFWSARDLKRNALDEMALFVHNAADDGRKLTGDNATDKVIWNENNDAIKKAIMKALMELDDFADEVGHLSDLDSSRTQLITLLDKRTNTRVSHRDVGIGVSQILPVLVHAYASQNRIVAIEQPEIHLHPKLQAELADVFIESALGERKNMFILESHSEHLMLRVLRRIRETADGELTAGLVPIRPEDVAVLYVSPTPEGSKVTEIPIRPDGEFAAPWPDGFFPERAKELF